MSVTSEPTVLCGRWVPKAKAYCARTAEHPPGQCRSPEALAAWRRRSASRERVVLPADKARWNRAHKFKRLGISEERFNELLEAQGHACAMCFEPFGE